MINFLFFVFCLYLSLDDGKVIKFINISPSSSVKSSSNSNLNQNDNYDIETVIISEIQALPLGMPVRELRIAHKTEYLIVIGDGHIKSIPLHHCLKINNCKLCLQIQDPYCVWDSSNYECKTIRSLVKNPTSNFIQSINTTKNIIELCEEYGDSGNRIDHNHNHHHHRPIAVQKGVLKAIGKAQNHPNYRENKALQDSTLDTNDLTNTINGK